MRLNDKKSNSIEGRDGEVSGRKTASSHFVESRNATNGPTAAPVDRARGRANSV